MTSHPSDTMRTALDGNATSGDADLPDQVSSQSVVWEFSSSMSVEDDITGPTVSSVSVPANATYKAGDTLDFIVSFDEAVTVDSSGGMPRIAVTLDTGGTVYANYASGSGTGTLVFSYTIASGNADADGVVLGSAIDHNGASLRDAAGNNAALTLNGVAPLGGVKVDTAAPYLGYIMRVGALDTSADSVQYNLTFDESVTGVGLSDFSLYTDGTAVGTLASISGSGADYVVIITGVAGDGKLRLDLKGSGTGITDLAGNPIPNMVRIGNQSYNIDNTAPAAPATPDLDAGSDSGSSNNDDITRNTTPTVTGSAENGATITLYDSDGTSVLGAAVASGGAWSITSSTLNDGVHNLSVKATDLAGNTSVASSNLQVVIDTSAPTAMGLSSTSAVTTAAGSGATLAALSATDGAAITYALAAGNGTNDADNGRFAIADASLNVGGTALEAGTYHIYLAATDVAGNVSHLAQTITVATVPTVVSIVRAGAVGSSVAASATSASYTVTFSEDVTGVDKGDFMLTPSGSADGVIDSVSGSGSSYTVTVGGLSGDGTLRLDLNASNTGIQSSGGAIAVGGGYTSGATYRLDHTPPAVSSVAVPANATYKTGEALVFTVNFNEAVTVNTGGGSPRIAVMLDTGGTVYATYVSGSGTSALAFSYTIASGNADANGIALGASIELDGATIQDGVGNSSTLALNSIGALAGVLVNGIAPAVSSIDLVEAATNNLSILHYTVTFSSAVSGVDKGDFSLSGSGVTGEITDVSGSGDTYTVTGANIAGDGTLRLDLNAGSTAIVDGVGNAIAGGYMAGASYTLDYTAPAAPVAVRLASSSDSGSSDSDGITSVTTPVIEVQGVAGSTVSVLDTDGVTVLGTAIVSNGGDWVVTPAGALDEGAHSITVVQKDVAGNVSVVSAPFALTIDSSAASAITLSKTSVSTGAAANAVVGSLGNDDLSGGAQASYTLVAGTGSDANAAFSIDNGSLRLIDPAGTTAGSYSVRVQVSDAAGNVYQQVLTVTVTNPPSQPSQPSNPPAMVDGVPVQTSPVTLPGGGTGSAVVVPVVQPGRTESDGSTPAADIPLVRANGGDALVAHVPVGVGLTSTGGASQPAGASLAQLIAAIVARTPGNSASDQAHLTSEGQQFVSTLDTAQPLLVNTIVVNGGNSGGAPLVLTGTASSSLQTALVIDATGATGSSGAQLVLEQLAFAAIIGRATVSGDTNGQVLTGDAASQHFVVGAVNDSQVYSGGGDDMLEWSTDPASMVGMARSAVQRVADEIVVPGPLLFDGGAGADMVILAGDRDDYTVVRGDAHLVVTDKVSGASATLVNVETLQFADASVQLDSRAELATIAALYANALGRQADVSGFEFWGRSEDQGVSLGAIALGILGSSESIARGNALSGSAEHDVALLYQALFGRAADAAGAGFWRDAMEQGVTVEQVADAMLASAEMQTHVQAPAAWDFYF